MWNIEALDNHKEAANSLLSILKNALKYISNHKTCTEFDVTSYILTQFKQKNLRTDEPPMVAFRHNTNNIHYIADSNTSLTIKPESLIMIDLWAGINQKNAPFADVTWMAYYGKKPSKAFLDTHQHVHQLQSKAISFIQNYLKEKQLPMGKDIDAYIKKSFQSLNSTGQLNNFTGHVIGYTSPHGVGGNLNSGSDQHLHTYTGYTLEPEIDHTEFGNRQELNFYIDDSYQLHLSTPQQPELTILK